MSKGRFSDKVVWITGASAGIGRELAREFAREGAILAVSARRVTRLEELVAELTRGGGQALAVPCDVTDEAQLSEAVKTIVERFGRLDVAVANAGLGVAGTLEQLSFEDWRYQLDTNVIGAALTARFALPELKKTRGRVALIGSIAAMINTPRSGAYSASKAAVRAIGATLSMELDGSGVSCTTIHPGFVESEIAQVDNRGVHDPSRKDKRPARLMWKADRAARVVVAAIHRREREFVFTGHGKVGAFVGQHFPAVVHAVMIRAGSRMPVKKPG